MGIFIYSDEGVSRNSLESLRRELEEAYSYPVNPIKDTFFLSHNWESAAKLVVFPGGRDKPYHRKLKGEANRRIAAFVRAGGSYLGVCAGGYYGASEIVFERGGPLEVCGSRELAFFPGRAVGPAYGNGRFAYDSERGACVAPVSWDGGIAEIYYNGGCYFEGAEDYEHVEVLARYYELPRSPAAAVLCHVGQGRALLCGIHPELPTTAPEPPRKTLLNHFINRVELALS